jgi:hypothetical protein
MAGLDVVFVLLVFTSMPGVAFRVPEQDAVELLEKPLLERNVLIVIEDGLE